MRLNRFRVASRTASVRRREEDDAASLGRQLRVDAVLEGSVRRAGGRLRVAVQLVETNSGFCLWSDRYDRELADVFAIQEEIAEQVVRGLSGVFGPEDRARLVAGTTEQLEAYEYYLRGRMLVRQGRRVTLEAAIGMFERAIAIDPNYALAYSGIAGCRNWLYTQWGGERDQLDRADAAGRRALDLAPTLAEARVARAATLEHLGDVAGAERELDEAVRLNPKLAMVQRAYGDHCFRKGQYDRAIEYLSRAAALDPDMFEPHGIMSMMYKRMGREEDAARASQRSYETASRAALLNPGDARAAYMSGIALLRLGQREKGAPRPSTPMTSSCCTTSAAPIRWRASLIGPWITSSAPLAATSDISAGW
jgi:adenylate cyclase